MSAPAPGAHRLLIAAASLADAEAAAGLARSILDVAPARPTGLLIETAFASLATGARHRVVADSGSLLGIPSADQSRHIRQGEVRALRRLIAGLAAGRSTDWACDTIEGDLVACACAASAGDDILLLCRRPVLRLRGPVLLLGGAGASAETPRALAAAVARACSTAVTEIALSAQSDLAQVFATIDRTRLAAIVADFTTAPLGGLGDLQRLVAAARCPVAVLGAGRIARAPGPQAGA